MWTEQTSTSRPMTSCLFLTCRYISFGPDLLEGICSLDPIIYIRLYAVTHLRTRGDEIGLDHIQRSQWTLSMFPPPVIKSISCYAREPLDKVCHDIYFLIPFSVPDTLLFIDGICVLPQTPHKSMRPPNSPHGISMSPLKYMG
jgi:hypothetical protein